MLNLLFTSATQVFHCSLQWCEVAGRSLFSYAWVLLMPLTALTVYQHITAALMLVNHEVDRLKRRLKKKACRASTSLRVPYIHDKTFVTFDELKRIWHICIYFTDCLQTYTDSQGCRVPYYPLTQCSSCSHRWAPQPTPCDLYQLQDDMVFHHLHSCKEIICSYHLRALHASLHSSQHLTEWTEYVRTLLSGLPLHPAECEPLCCVL